MRERIAKGVIILTLCLLAALSYLFASLHNPEAPAEAGPDPAGLPALPAEPPIEVDLEEREVRERGQAVYTREGCAACHSIAGVGNPRYPLDGAGDRWEADELEAWTTGTGFAADLLPGATVRRKQRYRTLSGEDIKALVAYLSSLKSEPARRLPTP